MGQVKRPYLDHDDTCQPARKNARLQETSIQSKSYQSTRDQEQGPRTPPKTVANLAYEQSVHSQKGSKGRRSASYEPHEGNDTIQNRGQVKTYSEPKVHGKRSRSLSPGVSIDCQTDGLDERDIHKCPRCCLPCWLCNTAKLADKPLPEDIEDDMDERMSQPLTTATSSTKRRRNDGLIFLGPKEKNFGDFILQPSGVCIRDGIFRQKPEDIPQDNTQQHFSFDSEIFLKLNGKAVARISTQILFWHRRLYGEGELVDLINKHLTPWDDLIDRDGPQGIVSMRRRELKVVKGGPALGKQLEYTYDWEIVPDKTYMLALNLFDDELRKAIRGPQLNWLRADSHGICPYLTLEYKCAEKSGKDSDAMCQIAVASVVWLHEWKKLKDKLGISNFSDLRHYSIIINSLNFHIWLTSFDGKEFTVLQIFRGLLDDPQGVEKYMEWWNAIHKWGLSLHAQSFKKDVETLWESMKEPTIVGLTPPPSLGNRQSSDGQAQS